MIKLKKCENCKQDFSPKYRVTNKYWEKRKFCSNQCKEVGMSGRGRSTKGKERTTIEEKFWSKVDKKDENECWIWKGATEKSGYGFIKDIGRTKNIKAHRLSYELNKGSIPKGLCVCHTCDNPPCVNPNHLWLGTRAENNFDRIRKGRTADHHGENNPRAKLKEVDVIEIVRLRHEDLSQQKIADKFGVSQVRISSILLGKTWKHLIIEI